MDKEILYEILNSKSERLPLSAIQNILDEELDKSPEEMDADLIDLCLDALESVDKEKLNNKITRIRITRILVAAVIFVLVIGAGIPVCAKHFNMDVPSGIVSIYKDCFRIDISNDNYVKDIVGQLEKDGIADVALPKIVFSTETKIYDYEKINEAKLLNIRFKFANKKLIGYITIDKNDMIYDFVNGSKKVKPEYEKIKHIDRNNIDVLVFYNDGISCINYSVSNKEYNISLKCDFETACEIAETI